MGNTISPARQIALDVLHRVSTQGAFASAALRAEINKAQNLDNKDKRLATDLVYGVLRLRAQLDKAILKAGNTNRSKAIRRFKDLEPKLHDILRLAAYQIIFLDRVPDHAAVTEAVEQAKFRRGKKGAGQCNAILRQLVDCPAQSRLITAPELDRDPIGHVALAGSVSRAIAEIWVEDLGPGDAIQLAVASLCRAPLVLRTNLLATSREDLIKETRGEAGAHPLAVHLPEGGGRLPADFSCVREGRATVQDEASMHIIDLLDPKAGEHILDVCAAPGGKTTAIAERMNDQGVVIAYDRTPKKLEHIRRNASRLNLSSIQVAEVLPLIETTFDRVLVDAPCSGLGTLRRHPEIRWRFRKDDLDTLTRTQIKVLKAGADRLKPGGTLVYAVCTNTRAESEEIVRSIEHLELIDEIRLSPDEKGQPDAFFAAKFVKN